VSKRVRAARQWRWGYGWQVTKRARGMKRTMTLATRVECDEESDGFCDKSNGNEGGRQLTATRAMAMATATKWVMVMVTRLAGDEEGG
jgi:hypothetical protein